MEKGTLQQFIQKTFPSNPKAIEKIVEAFTYKKIEKHGFLLKEGFVSNEYFFLQNGFLRAFTFKADGDEVTTNFFFENRMVFEVSSLFLRVKSLENIQALTDTEGFSISFEQLNLLFHTIPEFREFGRMMLVKEFTEFKQRALTLINSSAEERYYQLLQSRPEIFQNAPLKYIASYLGMTDTSLSRIRKDLANKW